MHFQGKKLAYAVGLAVMAAGLPSGVLVASAAASELEARMAKRGDSTSATFSQDLRLPSPIDGAKTDLTGIAESKLRRASNRHTVLVRLNEAPVAQNEDRSRSALMARKQAIQNHQERFIERSRSLAPGGRVVGRTQMVINAVLMDVDASQINGLASDPDVFSVNRVKHYEKHLPETVPYIGGTTVQNMGYDGSGVRVGVVDSGIDYYHAALDGTGDMAQYAADDPNVIEPGTFPTAKVVGGYDFVGSNWGDGSSSEAPDEDPLDDGPEAGHGTHVADIIGGALGVAPGAQLYALKVCSSVSSACSGIGLIQATEWAADPNGDGDPSDRLDIVNMSLGSDYGQPFDDDLSAAVENLTALGTLVVASAGNGGNKPYITGSPSSTPSALSVAQTEVPSAVQPILEVNGNDYAAVFQPWSTAPATAISGTLQYADGAGGNLDGCAAFAPGSLNGLAVLIDRGGCNFTLKVKNVQDAGAVIGIIGLIAPGDPFSGGDGGEGPITIPGYMVSQDVSNAFKAQLGETLAVDPNRGISLAGHMVGSSSRGPQHESTQLLKPEIGAPGASVSAVAGTGTGTGPFGGTSGAAPMVSGSAALLLEMLPGIAPLDAKALLVNNGNTDISTDPSSGLAPVSRIGGGEVQVDESAHAPAIAVDRDTGQPTLSFGFHDIDRGVVQLHKTVLVTNRSSQTLNYTVNPTFRYPQDEASGAVQARVSP
ncbi:MAG: S8 family serine peptidase, partial [Parahaliea sp.]